MYERVFVLEVSGPTLDILSEYKGHLQVFGRFMDQGACSRLIGPLQPILPTTFATLFTGKNPGKTGFFDSFKFPAGAYRRIPCEANLLREMTLYQLLSESGKRVGLLNVPLTDPLPKLSGFVVSGDEGIGDEYAYPREVLQTLSKEGYFVPFNASFSPGRELDFFKHSMQVLEMRRSALNLLFRNQEWQFGMLSLYAIGELMHAFWKYYDQRHPMYRPVSEVFGGINPLMEALKLVDQILGDITELAGPTGLVIMLGAWGHCIHNTRVHLNTILEKEGYLRFRKGPKTLLKYLLYRTGFTASNAEKLAHRLNLYRLFHYKLNRSRRTAVTDSTFISYKDVDWSRTKAVAMGNHGQIYLNVRKHRPCGLISETDYDSERDRLCRILTELRDPHTGEPVVDHVFNRDEIYAGPELVNAPDLVIQLREGYSGDSGFSERRNLMTASPPNLSSEHWNQSVFLALGNGIGRVEVKARMEDIAPTILYALGTELPKECDGRVLPIFT
jgi:predicted AlkP superfamily phosphohydrolase/phosphomutase